MAKLVHCMIRVLDETRSVEFYRSALDLEVVSRNQFDGFTLIYLSNQESEFELELTVNIGRTQPYSLGDGYGHVAVTTNDIQTDHTRLSQLGHSVGKITEMLHDGELFARFFFLTDPDGYKIEFIQRNGRFI